MTDREYIVSCFPKVQRYCPGMTLEGIQKGAVKVIRVLNERKGFISMAVEGTRMVILGMFLEPGAPKRLMELMLRQVERSAKENGCKTIEFDTTRPGWTRRLPEFSALPWYRMVKEL